MPLVSLSLAAVVVVGLLAAITWRELLAARAAVARAADAEQRYRTWSGERTRFQLARASVADAAQTATDAVQQFGSAVSQASRRVNDAMTSLGSGRRRSRRKRRLRTRPVPPQLSAGGDEVDELLDPPE